MLNLKIVAEVNARNDIDIREKDEPTLNPLRGFKMLQTNVVISHYLLYPASSIYLRLCWKSKFIRESNNMQVLY